MTKKQSEVDGRQEAGMDQRGRLARTPQSITFGT